LAHLWTLAYTALLILLLADGVKAETWSDVWKGLESSFELPTEQWSNIANEQNPLEQFAQQWSADAGLTAAKNNDGGYAPVANATLKFMPAGCWFAETGFFYYIEKNERKSWEPDFIYRFGCEDWRPYALSLIYSNFAGNRSYSDIAEKYDQGTYALTWNLPVPDSVARPFLIETEKKIGCKLNLLHSPRYVSEDGALKHDMSRLSLSFDAPVYGGWYLSFSLFHYVDNSQLQPWSPDYTYEFGWRNEKFSISYKNYGGNRFPWRSSLPHDSNFADGSIAVSCRW